MGVNVTERTSWLAFPTENMRHYRLVVIQEALVAAFINGENGDNAAIRAAK
jgi:hypothetical protein